MRILFSTCSGANYMAPPKLADDQINCGPFFRDRDIGGHYVSLETPKGDYDLAVTASRLPIDQQPDAVVCLVDASWFNTPRNLAAFKCPRIALVADTHHMKKPITGMIQYLLSQPFDRIVFLYTRHHLDLFREAGLKNLFWFPGLTFPHSDSFVRSARSPERQNRIALIGQAGNLHQRRLRLAGALAGAGLPLVFREASQREGLEFYGSSLLGFNATANADLNLRVFEIMASGSAMLMDRLAPASGLDALWCDGRDYVGYSSAADLVERARFYTKHPEKARVIGDVAAHWFDTHFNESRRRADFAALVFDSRPAPLFALTPPKRTFLAGFDNCAPHLSAAMRFYEHLQHVHSTAEQVTLVADQGTPSGVEQLAATLPRVRVVRRLPETEIADCLVTTTARALALTKLDARGLWCWDATADDLPALAARFKGAGLLQPRDDLACFELPASAAPVDKLAADARRLLIHCDLGNAFELARRALQQNPNSLEALLVMAELALEGGKSDLLAKMLARAREVAPDEPRIPLLELSARSPELRQRPAERLLAVALRHVSGRELSSARAAAHRALKTDENLAAGWFWLAQIAVGLAEGMDPAGREREIAIALHHFRYATQLSPDNPVYWCEFAHALHRVGLVDQAATAFERVGLLDSSDAVSCWLGALTLLQLREPKRAARLAEMALEHAPTHRPLLLALGHARKQMGAPADGIYRQACGVRGGVTVNASEIPRAIFVVQSIRAWERVRELCESMALDGTLATFVVHGPGVCFGEPRLDARDWNETSPSPGDVVVLHDANDAERPSQWRTAHLLGVGVRLVFLPTETVSRCIARTRFDEVNSLLGQVACLVIVPNSLAKQEYADHCVAGDAHVCVAERGARVSIVAPRPEDRAWAAGRIVVAWVPSSDLRLEHAGYGAGLSTFLRWREFLVREMESRPGVGFLVCIDPRLAERLEKTGAESPGAVQAFFSRLRNLPNVRLEIGPDAEFALPDADALVGDATNCLLEFAATGRPALLLRNPHGPELTADLEAHWHRGLAATREAAIRRFLDSVVERLEERAAAANSSQPDNGPRWAAVVKCLIERQIAAAEPSRREIVIPA